MTLSDWAKNDWLKPHKTSQQEIQNLLTIVARELADAQIMGISTDGRFNHAYRACLTLATAMLYASGYMPARGQSHHWRTIAALPEILGAPAQDDADYLDQCRSKRNAAEYDAANAASESEADELLGFAKEFERRTRRWLRDRGYS